MYRGQNAPSTSKRPLTFKKATMSGFMGKESYINIVKHFERELEKRRFGTAKEKPVSGRFTNQEKYLLLLSKQGHQHA